MLDILLNILLKCGSFILWTFDEVLKFWTDFFTLCRVPSFKHIKHYVAMGTWCGLSGIALMWWIPHQPSFNNAIYQTKEAKEAHKKAMEEWKNTRVPFYLYLRPFVFSYLLALFIQLVFFTYYYDLWTIAYNIYYFIINNWPW